MAFLYGCPEKTAAILNLFSSAKRPVFSVSGAWQGSDIPFEMSRTHYFTLQNYHKTTDKQSKIRVFCFAHPTSNTNFAETFRDRAVVCSDFGCPGNSVIVSCGIKLSPSSIRLPTQTAPVCKQLMRVLLVNTSETVGGAAMALNRLLRALNRNGVEVSDFRLVVVFLCHGLLLLLVRKFRTTFLRVLYGEFVLLES